MTVLYDGRALVFSAHFLACDQVTADPGEQFCADSRGTLPSARIVDDLSTFLTVIIDNCLGLSKPVLIQTDKVS